MPEARRKQLYDEYFGILEEAGVLASKRGAAVAAGRPPPPLAPAETVEGTAEGAASPEQLDWLRAEQARLKEEYSRWGGRVVGDGAQGLAGREWAGGGASPAAAPAALVTPPLPGGGTTVVLAPTLPSLTLTLTLHPHRMEAKLKAMESRLVLGGGGGERGGAPAVEEGAPVSFHFKDGLPTAADFVESLQVVAAPPSGDEAVAVNGTKGVGQH